MERIEDLTTPAGRAFEQRIPVRRILIACTGNIFLRDDGFGVEVAQRLMSRKTKQYPEGVQVVDFGIRGIDLAYTLLDDYDTLVLVDAVSRGGSPGTLYLIEPDLTGIDAEKGVEAGRVALDAHSMDPVKVLALYSTVYENSEHVTVRHFSHSPLRMTKMPCDVTKMSYTESGGGHA